MDIFNKKKVTRLDQEISNLRRDKKRALDERDGYKKQNEQLLLKYRLREVRLEDIVAGNVLYIASDMELRYIVQIGELFSISYKEKTLSIPGQLVDFLKKLEINDLFTSKENVLEYAIQTKYLAKREN